MLLKLDGAKPPFPKVVFAGAYAVFCRFWPKPDGGLKPVVGAAAAGAVKTVFWPENNGFGFGGAGFCPVYS